MNYYEVLSVSRDADKLQIKRAYFDKVKTHTPDKDPEGFKAIRLAYETLYDEKKRADYDTYFTVPDEVQKELLAARELMRQNKFREAAAFLAKLSAKNTDPTIVRLQAEALWRSKKPGKAEALCKALLGKNPRDAETLLLRAKISDTRGHMNRSKEYIEQAYLIDPGNPKVSRSYMHYALQHQHGIVWWIGLGAVISNPAVFRDDYEMYSHTIYSYMIHDIQTPPPFHKYEESQHQTALQQCFALFTEGLAADKDIDEITYKNTLHMLSHVAHESAYATYIKKLLSILAQCRQYDKEDDMQFNDIRACLAVSILQADDRIHDVLADLTGVLIGGEDERGEQLSMECYIVMQLSELRGAVKALRDHYPEYFKLNQLFYLDVLNKRKAEFLTDKYYALYKRLRRENGNIDIFYDEVEDTQNESGPDDEDNAGYTAYGEVISHSSETLTPYIRETPKVGRNDPCPCGSGKKYKKCCG